MTLASRKEISDFEDRVSEVESVVKEASKDIESLEERFTELREAINGHQQSLSVGRVRLLENALLHIINILPDEEYSEDVEKFRRAVLVERNERARSEAEKQRQREWGVKASVE